MYNFPLLFSNVYYPYGMHLLKIKLFLKFCTSI